MSQVGIGASFFKDLGVTKTQTLIGRICYVAATKCIYLSFKRQLSTD